MRKLWPIGILVGATLLCGASGGCRLRKGFVLRGDWSIELNRVPHLVGHGPCYGCSGGCRECATCQQHAAAGCLTAPGDPAEQLPVPADRAAAAPQRFLPVPTRPAFQPAFDGWSAPLLSPAAAEPESIELPPLEDGDGSAGATAPAPPQPSGLRLRPLPDARAHSAAEARPDQPSPATARMARRNSIPQKGRHPPPRPRERF